MMKICWKWRKTAKISVRNCANNFQIIKQTRRECIASYLGEDAKWDCTKNGHNYTVTVKGKHGSDNYTISFLIVYDGFTYRKFAISDVIKNKVSLRDDEFSAVCKEIFTEDKSDTDSSNEESSNSQTK